MAAAIYKKELEQNIVEAKARELALGVDGFLIYDLKFLDCLNNELFNVQNKPGSKPITWSDQDLLNIPKGLVTRKGLEKNVRVGINYISSWMAGQGTFILDGSVEDSATAEISRFQVWQWLRHGQVMDGQVIDLTMVKSIIAELHLDLNVEIEKLFLELVQTSPQFITTWLNELRQ